MPLAAVRKMIYSLMIIRPSLYDMLSFTQAGRSGPILAGYAEELSQLAEVVRGEQTSDEERQNYRPFMVSDLQELMRRSKLA